jgi:hypothetical protein
MSASTIEWIAERNGFRAGIELRADGLFQVHLERWVPGVLEAEEPAHWSPVELRVILADNQPGARALAEEELRGVAAVVRS